MATKTSDSPSLPADPAPADEAPTAVQKLREQADAVVQRIQPRIAAVSTFAREEPTKALLISAATGAALMGLVALMTRSSSRATVPGQRRAESVGAAAMAAIRAAALDLADRAQTMASDAIDATQQRAAAAVEAAKQRAVEAVDSAKQRAVDAVDSTRQRASDALDATRKRANDALDAGRKRANEAVDSAQQSAADTLDTAKKRAASAAESVSASVNDAWQSVRAQAAPVVDRVKPQLDAVASYAKEDPVRTAIGAAAAAALVIGLVALARRSQDD